MQFLLTTNSGPRICTGSVLLDEYGEETGEHPRSNENEINLLAQVGLGGAASEVKCGQRSAAQHSASWGGLLAH